MAADANGEEKSPRPDEGHGPSGIQPSGGRWGRTPAEPYAPDGKADDTPKKARRPAEDHPWRRPFQRKK